MSVESSWDHHSDSGKSDRVPATLLPCRRSDCEAQSFVSGRMSVPFNFRKTQSSSAVSCVMRRYDVYSTPCAGAVPVTASSKTRVRQPRTTRFGDRSACALTQRQSPAAAALDRAGSGLRGPCARAAFPDERMGDTVPSPPELQDLLLRVPTRARFRLNPDFRV